MAKKNEFSVCSNKSRLLHLALITQPGGWAGGKYKPRAGGLWRGGWVGGKYKARKLEEVSTVPGSISDKLGNTSVSVFLLVS